MPNLKRRISPFNMLLISINGMIGSAWLFAPFYAAKIAGTGAIISWLLGGMAAVLIALTFVELSSSLPVTGGSTRFSHLSHGLIAGYTISWLTWLSAVTMAPIEVQAVLQYSATYFPSLTHLVNHVPVLTSIGLLWAVIIMLGLCIINIASFKGLIGFNQIVFSFKILVILFTIVWLIHSRFVWANFSQTIDPRISLSIMNWHTILSAVATGGIAFAFTGFKHGVEMAGETTQSTKAIPMAVVGSVIISLLLYLGLQIAFISALEPKWLAQGWVHLNFNNDAGPFLGIAAALGLAFLMKLLYVDAAISPLGAGLVFITSTARVIYAMSKNGYVPKVFTRTNKQSLPIAAIGLNFVIGILLFLPLPGWQNMVSFLVSAMVISYAVGPIALLSLRQGLPHLERPFRLPLPKLSCLLAFYFCNLISYWTGWDTMMKLGIALAIGTLIFLIALKRGKLKDKELSPRALIWLMPYLIGLIVISYAGTFGGGHGYLPFGWDFLVIGLFSVLILTLAVYSQLPDMKTQLQIYQQESAALT
jgi:amino acid transporter